MNDRRRTIIRGARLIDGTGGPPLDRVSIAIEGATIAAIGGDELAGPGAEIIDAAGKTVVPGLIDLHVHICHNSDPKRPPEVDPLTPLVRAVRNVGRLLRAGVTTVREAGGEKGYSFTVKANIADGTIEGPRLLVSGLPLAMTGGHGWNIALEVDGPDEARKGAREQIKRGAEWVKLMATGGVSTPGEALGAPQMTVEEMAAACEEVHKAGRRAMAHAMGPIGIRAALAAGVDTIEHGVWFGQGEIELMIAKGVHLVPTFSVSWMQAQYGRDLGMAPHVVEKATQAAETMFRCTEEARKAGVKIAMGTDAGGRGVDHSMVALELDLMLRSGACATPMEVIESATRRGAEVLGRPDLGTIAPGRTADLLVLDRDPLEGLDAFRSVRLVFKDGRLAHRSFS